jgi:VanZ family protein
MLKPKRNKDLFFWAALTAAALLIIIFFGLRHKDLRFENPVTVLPEKGAIAFQKNGISYVDDFSSARQSRPQGELTIEMAVRAEDLSERRIRFRALLMLHDGRDHDQLLVAQWGSAIVAMNGNDYDHSRRWPRVVAKDVLSTETIRLITVTAGGGATRLYVDGSPAGARNDWQLRVPDQGRDLRMVVGNSVSGKNSWRGEIHGLALYGQSFSPAKVKGRYERWAATGRFPFDPADAPLVLYTFDALEGRQVADRSGNHHFLQVPERTVVLKKVFLAPPWRTFNPGALFSIDASLNFFGFLPLGAVLFGLLKAATRAQCRNGVLVVAGACFLVSLGLETVQAWIATRHSSLLDLFLNTLGGGTGAWVFKRFRTRTRITAPF